MDIYQTELISSRHKHKLVWFPGGERYYCSGCREEGGKEGYRCPLPSCADFMLHRECAGLPDVHQNSFHVSEELTFCSRTRIGSHNCSACQNTIKGFLFKVPRRLRSFNVLKPSPRFHPLCITLPQIFTFSKHENHSLKLFKVNGPDYSCRFCSKRCRGWRYYCQGCPYALDLTCAKLDMQGLLEHPSQAPAIPKEGNRNDISNPTANFAETFTAAVAGGLVGEIMGNALL